jgi:5S rRNA maturation endonuclease (ribonuclease M5)
LIFINKQNLNVDFYSELEPYLDQFPQYVLRDNKIQSCSPFRIDRNPSFAVNLENGTWIDSGATGEYHKGHFLSLLSFLREESVEDTSEYLLRMYSPLLKEESDLHLDMTDFGQSSKQETLKIFSADELKQFAFRHPYLGKRGISEEVQQQFRVGYDSDKRAVAMCWCNADGDVVNIKFRSVDTKHFWYANGQRIKNHLYGYHNFIKNSAAIVTITESEIDCMRLWTLGIPAVALGTAHISQQQVELLFKLNVEELVIATDNDAAGRECAGTLEEIFAGTFRVTYFDFDNTIAKDISDLSSDEITLRYENRKCLEFVLK